MLPFIVTFITYKDVFHDNSPSITEIQEFFYSLHTPHLIQALGKLNIVLWKETNSIKSQIKIAKLFFETDELRKLAKALKYKKVHIPFIFHRQQIFT